MMAGRKSEKKLDEGIEDQIEEKLYRRSSHKREIGSKVEEFNISHEGNHRYQW